MLCGTLAGVEMGLALAARAAPQGRRRRRRWTIWRETAATGARAGGVDDTIPKPRAVRTRGGAIQHTTSRLEESTMNADHAGARASCVACAGAVAARAARCCRARAYAQIEIKLGHVGEPGSLFQKSADEFAKRANAKLGGKAKVVTFGSSQLGGDKEMIQKLKLGTLDMALPSTVMSSQVDLFGVFEMPYIVKDREHMATHREGDLLGQARARGREEGPEGARGVGERRAPHHQQQAADQGARRPRRASSCACPKASGGSRCSRPTAPIRAR